MPNTSLKTPFKGLYVITDPTLSNPENILEHVAAALKGGAHIVQFRDKTSDFVTQLAMAKQLKTLCDQYQAWFIVNDNLHLAQQSQAHGIHIGKNDSNLKSARQALGQNAIIGVSCYNDLTQSLKMQNQGADYVAFGRFFPSLTKPNAPQADLQTLIEAKRALSIPIVAIGGINAGNASQLIATEADALAVIQGVFAQKNIEVAARQISRQFTP